MYVFGYATQGRANFFVFHAFTLTHNKKPMSAKNGPLYIALTHFSMASGVSEKPPYA